MGASDAPVLAGVSPWKTVWELWDDKLGLVKDQEPNYAMSRGISLEPVARDIYEFQYGVQMPAKRFEHPKYNFMAANLDGWNEEHKYLIEIKCPGKADQLLAQQNLVPEKYYPQLQFQMMCADAKFGDYVTFDGKETIWVTRVFANRRYQQNLIRLSRWFWHQVETKTPIKRYSIVLKGQGA